MVDADWSQSRIGQPFGKRQASFPKVALREGEQCTVKVNDECYNLDVACTIARSKAIAELISCACFHMHFKNFDYSNPEYLIDCSSNFKNSKPLK